MKIFPQLLIACCIPLLSKADEPKNLLKPANDLKSWRFEQHETATGTHESTEKGSKFTVTQTDGTNWHLQAMLFDLDLKEGQKYTIKFKAKSPEGKSYLLLAAIDQEDWHEIGLHEDLVASKEFREERFTFTATSVVDKKNRLGFVLGDDKGSLIIEDLSLSIVEDRTYGEWTPKSAILNGMPMPDEFLTAIQLKVNAEGYEVKIAGQIEKGTLVIRRDRRPMEMDVLSSEGPNKGKTIPTIFEEPDRDSMTVCYSLNSNTRPDNFSSTAENQWFLVQYKRKTGK